MPTVGGNEQSTVNSKIVEELPHIVGPVYHDPIVGDPVALAMNAGLIEGMQHLRDSQSICEVECDLLDWLKEQEEPLEGLNIRQIWTVAGKNVGVFDIPFLEKTGFGALARRFHYRTLDVGAAMFDFSTPTIPSLSALLPKGREVQHTAYQDALDVIEVLRGKYAQ